MIILLCEPRQVLHELECSGEVNESQGIPAFALVSIGACCVICWGIPGIIAGSNFQT